MCQLLPSNHVAPLVPAATMPVSEKRTTASSDPDRGGRASSVHCAPSYVQITASSPHAPDATTWLASMPDTARAVQPLSDVVVHEPARSTPRNAVPFGRSPTANSAPSRSRHRPSRFGVPGTATSDHGPAMPLVEVISEGASVSSNDDRKYVGAAPANACAEMPGTDVCVQLLPSGLGVWICARDTARIVPSGSTRDATISTGVDGVIGEREPRVMPVKRWIEPRYAYRRSPPVMIRPPVGERNRARRPLRRRATVPTESPK